MWALIFPRWPKALFFPRPDCVPFPIEALFSCLGDWRGYPFLRGETWGEARAPTAAAASATLPLLRDASYSTSGSLWRDPSVSCWWLFCSFVKLRLLKFSFYLGKMCDTGRKAGVRRQRRAVLLFLMLSAPLWKLRLATLDASWKRRADELCTAWSSKGRTDRLKGGKETGECARLFSLLHTFLFTEPQKEISLSWWGWDGKI